MTLLSLRALRLANKRGVLLGGWAACSADDVENEPDTEELKAFCKEKVQFRTEPTDLRVELIESSLMAHWLAGGTEKNSNTSSSNR